MNDFLGRAVPAVRERFAGKVAYASIPFERVDWEPFDFVGVDLYRSIEVADRYRDGIRTLVAQGKPVAITEVGTAPYRGAGDRGARAGEIIVWDEATGLPVRLDGVYERDEAEQVAYLRELLEIFDAEGVDSAFVFAFELSRLVHRPDGDPRDDLDIGSYGIVKTLHGRHGTTYPDMTWSRKRRSRRLPRSTPRSEGGSPCPDAGDRLSGMTDRLRVILEIGKKRRVVAGAMDWPGLDRWGTSEDAAIEVLSSYLAALRGVAERAGLASEFERARDIDVVERVPGSSSTDFWGVAHVPSEIERAVLSPPDLERRLDLLRACWASFDDIAAHASAELRPGSRNGGRSRDEIIRHVYGTEPSQFSRKIEVRTPFEVVMTPDGLAAHRAAYLDAIRAWNAEGKPARTWPIQFLIRRTAHHVMDHAWEIEDRDPGT